MKQVEVVTSWGDEILAWDFVEAHARPPALPPGLRDAGVCVTTKDSVREHYAGAGRSMGKLPWVFLGAALLLMSLFARELIELTHPLPSPRLQTMHEADAAATRALLPPERARYTVFRSRRVGWVDFRDILGPPPRHMPARRATPAPHMPPHPWVANVAAGAPGSRSTRTIRLVAARRRAHDPLYEDEIVRSVIAILPEMLRCYPSTRALRPGASVIQGVGVSLDVAVSPAGIPRFVEIAGDSSDDGRAASCLATVAEDLRFPETEGPTLLGLDFVVADREPTRLSAVGGRRASRGATPR